MGVPTNLSVSAKEVNKITDYNSLEPSENFDKISFHFLTSYDFRTLSSVV